MPNPPIAPFAAAYAPDDGNILVPAMAAIRLAPQREEAIDSAARGLIEGIRARAGGVGGVEDFLREYGLSTREGLALMVLAEALLRVPDAATQDRLIEDKLQQGGWSGHEAHGDTFFVAASAWALGLSARVIRPGETPEGVIASLLKRVGMPTVRTATKQAMRYLGHHFVLGETIEDALSRARANEAKGYRHSFDMLGEGARTADDAERYFNAYASAIEKIGRAAGNRRLPDRMGISVKLSALHPRYLATQRNRVLTELAPKVLDLAQRAKGYDLNFTIDAEEADRLELSLDVINAVFADPSLAGWDGFGLAIQAYQKRASAVITHLESLCRVLERRMMVRLVKGAYWDTEVKRAQERGLGHYPVFTRKPATDVNYLACARQLLAARPVLFPQFATHNALTVAAILEFAGNTSGFEFQRLHGMGEALYEQVTEAGARVPARIYAPVGGYRDLLAYLVRRLLENGANSSFVAVVGDEDVPVDSLLERPSWKLSDGKGFSHPQIPLPARVYGARVNSAGVEFGHRPELSDLLAGMEAAKGLVEARTLMGGTFSDLSTRRNTPTPDPSPQGGGGSPRIAEAGLQPNPTKVQGTPDAVTPLPLEGRGRGWGYSRDNAKEETPTPILSPADRRTQVGTVVWASPATAAKAVKTARAGHAAWSQMPVDTRARALEKAADALEANRDRFMALLAREAGKTLDDGIAEIREAVDFCRYYAAEARRIFGVETVMPGPTGEDNRLRWRSRGVFAAISPWNFPLAIFTGQVTAALAAGNAVIAKPAEQTPLVAFEMVRLLHASGVPQDALIYLPGDGAVGAALTADPGIDGVVFTGSTATARAINRALAARDGAIAPLIAETGGLNAMIVDATALPEQVTDDVIMSAFRSAGQRCSALRILYLQDSVADRMLEMIEGAARELKLGDPADPATDIGPVIDEAQRSMLLSHVDHMRATQRVRHAGQAPNGGLFVAPHIVELKRPQDLTEEIFGPILHVVRWKATEIESVLDSIVATGYGLTLGVHSRIDAFQTKVAERLGVGNVYVNRNMIGAVVGTQPFGGSGFSGTGFKAGGPHYLLRFAEEQVVSINTAAAGGNASLIAMGE